MIRLQLKADGQTDRRDEKRKTRKRERIIALSVETVFALKKGRKEE